MRTLFLLALAGCAPVDPSPLDPSLLGAWPEDQAPPPFVPVLTVSTLNAGQLYSMSVSGVPVGATVFIGRNTAGPGAGPCHPTIPMCANLANPDAF